MAKEIQDLKAELKKVTEQKTKGEANFENTKSKLTSKTKEFDDTSRKYSILKVNYDKTSDDYSKLKEKNEQNEYNMKAQDDLIKKLQDEAKDLLKNYK